MILEPREFRTRPGDRRDRCRGVWQHMVVGPACARHRRAAAAECQTPECGEQGRCAGRIGQANQESTTIEGLMRAGAATRGLQVCLLQPVMYPTERKTPPQKHRDDPHDAYDRAGRDSIDALLDEHGEMARYRAEDAAEQECRFV